MEEMPELYQTGREKWFMYQNIPHYDKLIKFSDKDLALSDFIGAMIRNDEVK
jgi:hypothetical protein